jgi:hypothetical protein
MGSWTVLSHCGGSQTHGVDGPGDRRDAEGGPSQPTMTMNPYPPASPLVAVLHCLAKTVQRGNREKFLVLFGNIFLVLIENRTSLKCTFCSFGGKFYLKKNTN